MSEQTALNTAEKEHFDHLSDTIGETWWGNLTPAGKERMRRRAVRFVDSLDDPSVRILELGCGAGTFTLQALKQAPELHLVGCDLSPKSLEIAADVCADYPNVSFVEADATATGLPDGDYDWVIGSSVLHHLPLAASLVECLRLLRPGGQLWFSEPNMVNPHNLIEKNLNVIGRRLQSTDNETAFVRWQLAATMVELGFVDVDIYPYDFLHPATPKPLMPLVSGLGGILERIPLVREICGSLIIRARKPEDEAANHNAAAARQ